MSEREKTMFHLVVYAIAIAVLALLYEVTK
jgi:hypothetical protein